MRLQDLAKELNLSVKETRDRLRAHGVEVKTNLSPVTDAQAGLLRGGATTPPAAPAAEAVSPPAKPAPAPATRAAAPARAATAVLDSAPAVPPPPPPPAAAAAPAEKAPAKPRVITLRGPIVVKDLAEQMELKPNQLIAELMRMNVFASINEKLELKVVKQLADKRGFVIEHEKKLVEHRPIVRLSDQDQEPEEDSSQDLLPRPPVVAFLGHVDHGKTSLLDRIRKAQVAQGEAGGITQHIGAYMVETQDRSITFLDTPGHEAFTAMRARGAHLTDIVVLVIAADEGIMPQTREAIQHAKAADVCILVALNKMDLPDAKLDRVMQQLQREGLAPEQWGGQIVCCPVSAKTGQGIEHLLEMIALQAEVLELRANPKRRAQGYVVEARLEPGQGPTATVLVRRGTLHVGDAVVCGTAWGRVKALINDRGVKLRSAGPSAAVQCLGLTEVPEAGAEFKVALNERLAREQAEQAALEKKTQAPTARVKRATLQDLTSPAAAPDRKELALILKTDVQGSLEAILQSIQGIPTNKIALKVLLTGVGNITGNDVLLASASNAIIIGFHVSVETSASSMAKREGVEIRLYSIIYELIDDIFKAMTGLLEPELREKTLGQAEIRQVFELSKKGRVAGCMVIQGRITSRGKVRVRRNGQIIFQGGLASLRRFQNDAAEVREGQECGLRVENFSDYQPNDIVEVYEIEKITQKL
jgi:translation initiation factor IF-2